MSVPASGAGGRGTGSPVSLSVDGCPVVTTGAAVVLLRILRKAHEKQALTDRGRSFTDDQAVA